MLKRSHNTHVRFTDPEDSHWYLSGASDVDEGEGPPSSQRRRRRLSHSDAGSLGGLSQWELNTTPTSGVDSSFGWSPGLFLAIPTSVPGGMAPVTPTVAGLSHEAPTPVARVRSRRRRPVVRFLKRARYTNGVDLQQWQAVCGVPMGPFACSNWRLACPHHTPARVSARQLAALCHHVPELNGSSGAHHRLTPPPVAGKSSARLLMMHHVEPGGDLQVQADLVQAKTSLQDQLNAANRDIQTLKFQRSLLVSTLERGDQPGDADLRRRIPRRQVVHELPYVDTQQLAALSATIPRVVQGSEWPAWAQRDAVAAQPLTRPLSSTEGNPWQVVAGKGTDLPPAVPYVPAHRLVRTHAPPPWKGTPDSTHPGLWPSCVPTSTGAMVPDMVPVLPRGTSPMERLTTLSDAAAALEDAL